jgi:hypothetical protein
MNTPDFRKLAGYDSAIILKAKHKFLLILSAIILCRTGHTQKMETFISNYML